MLSTERQSEKNFNNIWLDTHLQFHTNIYSNTTDVSIIPLGECFVSCRFDTTVDFDSIWGLQQVIVVNDIIILYFVFNCPGSLKLYFSHKPKLCFSLVLFLSHPVKIQLTLSSSIGNLLQCFVMLFTKIFKMALKGTILCWLMSTNLCYPNLMTYNNFNILN